MFFSLFPLPASAGFDFSQHSVRHSFEDLVAGLVGHFKGSVTELQSLCHFAAGQTNLSHDPIGFRQEPFALYVPTNTRCLFQVIKSLGVIFPARKNQPQIGVRYSQTIDVPDFFLQFEALAMVFKGLIVVALALIHYPQVVIKNGGAVRVPIFDSYGQAFLEVFGGAGIIAPIKVNRPQVVIYPRPLLPAVRVLRQFLQHIQASLAELDGLLILPSTNIQKCHTTIQPDHLQRGAIGFENLPAGSQMLQGQITPPVPLVDSAYLAMDLG